MGNEAVLEDPLLTPVARNERTNNGDPLLKVSTMRNIYQRSTGKSCRLYVRVRGDVDDLRRGVTDLDDMFSATREGSNKELFRLREKYLATQRKSPNSREESNLRVSPLRLGAEVPTEKLFSLEISDN